MKLVKQFTVDVIVEEDKYNEVNMEELIAETLEENGIMCSACMFSGDMTEHYKEYLGGN